MHIEYHKWYSERLNRNMELKVYGNYGKPLLVFPSSGGRFHEYEDFGMIDALGPFIEGLKIKVITIDSVDKESWMNEQRHPADKARTHAAYDGYVMHEILPFIYSNCNSHDIQIMTSGCSFGAFHAANFFFKNPWVFDTTILLSGIFSLTFSIGDYVDDNVYFNNPLQYLPGLLDKNYIEQFSKNTIIIGCGQGAWEEQSLDESYRLSNVLKAKNVEHWLDLWGYDVEHHWYWWKKMIVHYLDNIDL